MTENTRPQFESEPEDSGNELLYAWAGCPHPAGPLIPRPNALWNPLWPGLTRAGLHRPSAAAEVVLRSYLSRTSRHNPKAGLISRLDYAARNWWKLIAPADPRNNEIEGWMISQRVVRGLSRFFAELDVDPSDFDFSRVRKAAVSAREAGPVANDPFRLAAPRSPATKKKATSEIPAGVVHIHRSETAEDLLDEVKATLADRLDRLLKALYDLNDDGEIKPARKAPLIFGSLPDPAVLEDGDESLAVFWERRYDDTVRRHVRQLLEEDAGEWTVLTLLFIKLLHLHMAWLPKGINEKRQRSCYRPLFRHLRQCAALAGEAQAHPLADTAAGLLQAYSRVNLLLFKDDSEDPRFPEHPQPLDPRATDLPDSLHMDSSLGHRDSVREVKQWFAWMGRQTGDPGWEAMTPWVDEVAQLALEMASVRTDPFALGGLGMVGANASETEDLFRPHIGAWQTLLDGARAREFQFRGLPLTDRQRENLDRLPARFSSVRDADAQDEIGMGLAPTEIAVRAIQAWADRAAWLQLFFSTLCEMLTSHGLDRFQAPQGSQS